jgi:hypothetical protein
VGVATTANHISGIVQTLEVVASKMLSDRPACNYLDAPTKFLV